VQKLFSSLMKTNLYQAATDTHSDSRH